ncbi:MAG: amino acid ABC transporter permease [Acidimicrobiia bacterium]|nr:amino acid ABC transporter permease [Acidimicrobiia bacterium]
MTTSDITPDTGAAPPEKPPQGPLVWMRENLFSTPFNSVLSVVSIVVVVLFLKSMVGFIFDDTRRWEAVATNMRLYMTQAYAPEQFIRVWISVGVIGGLAGLSLGAWNVGSRIEIRTIIKTIINIAGAVALLAVLAPWGTGRYVWIAGAVAVGGGAWALRQALGDRAKTITVHTLAVAAAVLALVLIGLYTIPIGDYGFAEGQATYEQGTIDLSTSVPWTVISLVLVAAYFVGRWLTDLINGRAVRGALSVLWVLVLPFNVLIILRDPDWNPASEAGGFDFLTGTDVTIALVFVVGGGLVLWLLGDPRLGEAGRLASGVLLIGALSLWLFPMLIRVRLLALLFAAFALGAQTFGGDMRSRLRYAGLWAGLSLVLIYFLAAINTPSSLFIQGKSFLGGLTLTFVLALTSIFLSFPIGILMALGRTSSMPIFRVLSTVYIELVRGIPFITVLIFFDLILVLFLPEGLEFDSVTLAILAGTLFSGAYLAENVRGGLQSIPNGQYEAAKAMGLTTLQTTVFIVLPQALRAVIPAMVGQTIAIFKDTSLVAIIGLFDFLYIANNVIPNQTVFLGVRFENLLFIALIYWIFTFSFSRASLRIEKKLGLGER